MGLKMKWIALPPELVAILEASDVLCLPVCATRKGEIRFGIGFDRAKDSYFGFYGKTDEKPEFLKVYFKSCREMQSHLEAIAEGMP
jgi:hypothetical protein